ncbi:MAG: ComEC/Rec2 family competence protein [Anaerolineae bacterium]|nr:ComEC/Rec2 family competence protein [Anaerolineae bacterium]
MRLVYVALAWVVGIIAAGGAIALSPSAWLIFAVLTLACVGLHRRDPSIRFLWLLWLCMALGGLRMSLHPQTSAIAAYNNLGGLTLSGTVTRDPDVRDDRVFLHLQTDQVFFAGQAQPTSGYVLVQTPRTEGIRYGDRISATGLLIHPGESDTFSYADYLRRSEVFSIMRNAIITIESRGHGSAFYSALFDLRRDLKTEIARYLPEPHAGLLTGILLGDERGISPELEKAFSVVGVSHIVAISGFNMAVVSGVITLILSRFTTRKTVIMGIGIVTLIAYTLLVGANAAVVRAAVMSSLLLIGAAINRKTYVPASLSFVALLMSLQNPLVLWDLSFQLSFFATLGLALFADPLTFWIDRRLQRRFPEHIALRLHQIAEPMIVTFAALIFTLPLIAIIFNRLSLVVLPINLLVIPVQTALLLLGAVSLFLALILPPIAQIGFWFTMLLLSWTIEIVRLFARLPFAEVSFSLDPRLVLGFFVVIMGWAIMRATQPNGWFRFQDFFRQQIVLNTAFISGVGVLLLMIGVIQSRPDRYFHLWLLDVGHTNAIWMQTPGGAHILIDGGNFPSRLLTAIGDRMPFYDREIELLFVTTPDETSYNALTAVLARYEVGAVITNGQPNVGDAFEALQVAIGDRPVVSVTAGYSVDLDDGTRIEVLHPQRQPTLGEPLGDGALVLRVSYGEVSFLLTSNLTQTGQLALLSEGQFPLATVFQLPRHGAQGALNTDFLGVIQPSLILLQTDQANPFNHPHGDTLALLGDVPLYRTDHHGTIHLWTDGRQLFAQPERLP